MQIYSNNKKLTLIKACFLLLFLSFFNTYAFAQDASSAKEPWQGAYTSSAFAGGVIRNLYCDLAQEVEVSFGGMLFIVGGFVAFSFAVFGNAKRSYSIIMAGIAAATITGGISLSFGRMCNFDSSGAGAKSLNKNFESVQVDQGLELDSDNSLF